VGVTVTFVGRHEFASDLSRPSRPGASTFRAVVHERTRPSGGGKGVDFLGTLFSAGMLILVQKGNPRRFKGLDDCAASPVSVQKGTTRTQNPKPQVAKLQGRPRPQRPAAREGHRRPPAGDEDRRADWHDLEEFQSPLQRLTSGAGKETSTSSRRVGALGSTAWRPSKNTALRDSIKEP